MTVVSHVPSTNPDARAVELPHDIAVRLRAVLASRRDEVAAHLERLATADDLSVVDEHEISAAMANEAMQHRVRAVAHRRRNLRRV